MTNQMKSLQWPQNTGCLKNLLRNLWPWTTLTDLSLRAPARCQEWQGGESGRARGHRGEEEEGARREGRRRKGLPCPEELEERVEGEGEGGSRSWSRSWSLIAVLV